MSKNRVVAGYSDKEIGMKFWCDLQQWNMSLVLELVKVEGEKFFSSLFFSTPFFLFSSFGLKLGFGGYLGH